MKNIPEIKRSCSDIYNLVRMGSQIEIFTTALKWKIFDYLEKPVAMDIVSQKLGSHLRNTELLLNTLAGMSIIIKKDGLFFNTASTSEQLVTTKPEYLGSFLLHINEWHKQFGVNMEDLIKNGPPEEDNKDLAEGDMWAESARLSAAYGFAGPAKYITEIIKSLPEFPVMKTMLDLGGGAGIFTLGVVSAHKNLKGIIFEQPPVANVAKEFIDQYEAQDRVSVMEGDYINDPLGGPYDLIFASATLNFAKDRFDDLFKKIYDSLRPGGIFITHQDGVKAERTQPLCHLSEFLFAELYGADFAIPQGMIADAMLKAGFKSVRSFTQNSDFGEMDIDIARKAS